jgi:hypothetical protein
MHGTIEGNEAPDVEEIEYQTGEDHQIAQRHRRVEQGVIAALVVVVLAAIALIGFQSGADEKDDSAADRGREAAATTTTEAPTTEAPTTEAPTTAPTTAPAAPGAPAATGERPQQAEQSQVLEDGRHPVYLTGHHLTETERTLEFDLVQWLTGDDAIEYVEAHPDRYPGLYDEIEELGGYPYDQLVVNDNPRLRTLPVIDDPQITVIRTPDSSYSAHTIGLAELPDYLRQFAPADSPNLSYNVWWITVHDGEIVALEEQFQS